MSNGVTIINQRSGIIDAGLATLTGSLTLNGSVTNIGVVESTIASCALVIANATITNSVQTNGTTATGIVKTAKTGMIKLQGGAISGGTIAIIKGSSFLVISGTNTISGVTSFTNAGTLLVQSGNLTINGALNNTGALSTAAGTALDITGAVAGKGTASISGSGEIEFGGASATNVTFAPGSTGTLYLADASQFSGAVAGLSTGGFIDLGNIAFTDSSISFKKGKVIVSDSSNGVAANIKVTGVTAVTDKVASDGSTLIYAEPTAAGGMPKSVTLLTQSMASFGISRSSAGSATGNLTENHRSSGFLAAGSHHG